MKTGEEKDVIEKKDVTSPSTAPIRPEDGGDNDETSVTPGEGRSEAPSGRSKPFPQTPDTFLKARAEPEFVGEQRREQLAGSLSQVPYHHSSMSCTIGMRMLRQAHFFYLLYIYNPAMPHSRPWMSWMK